MMYIVNAFGKIVKTKKKTESLQVNGGTEFFLNISHCLYIRILMNYL